MKISPYPAPGFVHRVDVIRKRIIQTAGRSQQKCDVISLYTKVPARVGSLRTIDDNLEKLLPNGLSSANERLISLRGREPLNKMLQGDYIRIYWGTKPNLIVPSGAPNTSGPQVWINTPDDGDVLLSWDGVKFTDGGSYSIELDNGSWCIIYDTVNVGCLSSDNFASAVWPDPYSFLKFTGLPIDYRILKYDAQLDDLGRLHHYTVSVELEGKTDQVKQ